MTRRSGAGNPFPYQRPLRPDQVIDRETEIDQLLGWCEDGMLIRLDAPRRYGKTSLVRKLYAEAEKDATVGVLIDMKGVLTIAEIVTRIARAFNEFEGPIAKYLKPILSGIQAQFNVGFAGAGVGVKVSARQPDVEGALLALLDIPMSFTKSGWKRAIVCFDEFQDILRIEAADDKLRSAIQHHNETCAYIFAGSEPRMMNELFSKNRAFWAQAEPLGLAPLDQRDVAQYLTERFTASGKDIGAALTPLLTTAHGHPQRTMFLASKLWQATPGGGEATIDHWQTALAAAKLQEEPALDAEWRGLNDAERRLVRAIAVSEGHPYRKHAYESVGLPRGSVSTTAEVLADKYVVRQVGRGLVQVVDPLLEQYARDLADDSLPTPEEAGGIAS